MYCDFNRLTSLTLNNTSVSSFNCSNNLLTFLDVGGADNLGDLDCSNNKLVDLIFRDQEIIRIDCSNNSLESLDVWHMNFFTKLKCDGNLFDCEVLRAEFEIYEFDAK